MQSSFRRFNFSLVASTVALLGLGASALWTLDRFDSLPPPPITGTNCIDEKFKFLRENLADWNLVAIGSSVTWRNLNFAAVEGRIPDLRPVNGAPCHVRIHETAFLTRFYLDHMPSVRAVISVVGMRDFENCASRDSFFDREAARRYIFEGFPPWHHYFTNFGPRSFVADALHIRDMRSGADLRRTLAMTPYGDGPVMFTPPEIRLDKVVTPDCLPYLDDLAAELRRREVSWVVVLMPPMPAWGRAYDPSGERERAWRATMRERLQGTGALLIDGAEGPAFADRDFTDPDHLHWSQTATFTRFIFDRIEAKGALRSALRQARARAL
jgi:hypothetical protein